MSWFGKVIEAKRLVEEEYAMGVSQSNGEVENSVKAIHAKIRTLKSALEANLKRRVDRDEALVPWMVIHSAEMINRFQVGRDGKTPYERWKCKRFKTPMAEFGERVLYLKPKSKGKDKYESRWKEGIWIGAEDQSTEYRVVDENEIHRVSRIQRLANTEDRWGTSLHQRIKVFPLGQED